MTAFTLLGAYPARVEELTRPLPPHAFLRTSRREGKRPHRQRRRSEVRLHRSTRGVSSERPWFSIPSSVVAGLAALEHLAADPEACAALRLDGNSRVLLFLSEADTNEARCRQRIGDAA